jgi:WD40 repeat protein
VLAEAFNFPIRVALSSDGAALVTGTVAVEIWLWRVADRTLLLALQGHTAPVYGLALRADGRLLASGGLDGTVRLWEPRSGAALRVVRSDRRYERVDITGLTGVTAAQRAALLALGAVDHQG